jgi:hypothetical protein
MASSATPDLASAHHTCAAAAWENQSHGQNYKDVDLFTSAESLFIKDEYTV